MKTKNLIVVNVDSAQYKDRCLSIKKQLEAMHVDTSNVIFLPSDAHISNVEVNIIED